MPQRVSPLSGMSAQYIPFFWPKPATRPPLNRIGPAPGRSSSGLCGAGQFGFARTDLQANGPGIVSYEATRPLDSACFQIEGQGGVDIIIIRDTVIAQAAPREGGLARENVEGG